MNLPTVAITGSNGFLGSHTVTALDDSIILPVAVGQKFNLHKALEAIDGADKLIHLAGVNRGNDVGPLNILFAQQLSQVLLASNNPPSLVIYSNSTQAGNDTDYGQAKLQAGEILNKTCQQIGADFIDLKLPNLFGEHGKPFYNMVTSTFCHLLAEGKTSEVQDNKKLTLLYVKDAADLLAGNVPIRWLPELQETETVSGLLARLTVIAKATKSGQPLDTSTRFQRNLVSTYLSSVC
jgi:UDP-2-acetamido-2,6-beta-L-arabino-hexul-4-ose reductase